MSQDPSLDNQEDNFSKFQNYFNDFVLSNWKNGFKRLLNENFEDNINLEFQKHLYIRDPIWGEIKFNLFERHFLDCFFLQRLRNITQMGGARLVYPSANHKRFDHSLGTFAVISYIIEEKILKRRSLKYQENINKIFENYRSIYSDSWKQSLKHLLEENKQKNWMKEFENLNIINEDKYFQEKFRNWIGQNLKISMLIHDIGHFPFSHTFEVFLRRHKNIIQTYRKNYEEFLRKTPHEIRTRDLILGKDEVINSFFNKEENDNLRLCIYDALKKAKLNPELIAESIVGFNKFSLSNLVNGPLDADKMDYLARDNYFSISPSQIKIFDRIYRLADFKLVNNNIRMVFPEKTISPIMKIIITRQFEYRDIINHPVCRCYESLLFTCLEEILKIYDVEHQVKMFQRFELMNDDQLIQAISILGKGNIKISQLIFAIKYRILYKNVYSYKENILPKFSTISNPLKSKYDLDIGNSESEKYNLTQNDSFFINDESLRLVIEKIIQAKKDNTENEIDIYTNLIECLGGVCELILKNNGGILLFFNKPNLKFQNYFDNVYIKIDSNPDVISLKEYIDNRYKNVFGDFLQMLKDPKSVVPLFDFFSILDDYIYVYCHPSLLDISRKFFRLLKEHNLLDLFFTGVMVYSF